MEVLCEVRSTGTSWHYVLIVWALDCRLLLFRRLKNADIPLYTWFLGLGLRWNKRRESSVCPLALALSSSTNHVQRNKRHPPTGSLSRITRSWAATRMSIPCIFPSMCLRRTPRSSCHPHSYGFRHSARPSSWPYPVCQDPFYVCAQKNFV